jgi:hypothetical protein
MSVPRPGGDPNAYLYEQLRRDVLERIPQIVDVRYLPDAVEARRLRATFDPDRLDPPTGPEPPRLDVEWYRGESDDWFRIDFSDPNTGFHAGWHQDEDHPGLGRTHFQYSVGETEDRWAASFDHETPSLILWEIVEALLEEVHPEYNS